MDDQSTEIKKSKLVVQRHPKKWSKKNRVTTVILAIIVLIVIAIIVLISLGRLAVFIKEPYQTKPMSVFICDKDIVERYNNATLLKSDIIGGYAIDKGTLNSLTEEIKNLANYEHDPTCQTILFWAALYDDNFDEVKQSYEKVKYLYDKGLYANSEIRTLMTLSIMRQTVDEMSSTINAEE